MFFIARSVPSLGIKMGCSTRTFKSSFNYSFTWKELFMDNVLKFVGSGHVDLCQFDIEFIEITKP